MSLFQDYLRQDRQLLDHHHSTENHTVRNNKILTLKLKMKSVLSILIVASASIKWIDHQFNVFVSSAMSDPASSNRFVDQVVEVLKGNKNFDPLHLKSMYKMHFSRNIGHLLHPNHLEGDITVHSTVINGLSKVHRIGDAVVGSGLVNGSFSAKMALGDEAGIKANALVSIHGTHVHTELQVQVHIGRVAVSFDLEVNEAGNGTLATFALDQFEHVHFQVISLLADDVLADAYVVFFNEHAKKAITDAVKPIIEAELKRHKVGSY